MSRQKKKTHRPLTTIASVVIVLCIVVVGGVFLLGRPVGGAQGKSQIVTIADGSGTAGIAQILKKENLIRSEAVFRLQSRITGSDGKFIAGSYLMSKSMSTGDIISLIKSGKTAGHTIKVDEGEPIYKLADQLEKDGVCSKKEFYRELKDGNFSYEFVKDLPKESQRLEGFLYPDTYRVGLKATAHEVIDAMLRRFDQVVYRPNKKAVKKQGLTMRALITKASIIEKEAGTKEDREKVSSVIDNRIKKSMPLQMDSIISYIHKEDKIRATYDDIKVKSNYNPYTNKGLPPGPICSPSQTSIQAALHPADTKYIYFVASPKMDGTNVFSETYKDFEKDKKAFDKAYEKYITDHPGEK